MEQQTSGEPVRHANCAGPWKVDAGEPRRIDEYSRLARVLVREERHDPPLLESVEHSARRDSALDDADARRASEIVHQVVHEAVRLLADEKIDGKPACGDAGAEQLPAPEMPGHGDDSAPPRDRTLQMLEPLEPDDLRIVFLLEAPERSELDDRFGEVHIRSAADPDLFLRADGRLRTPGPGSRG